MPKPSRSTRRHPRAPVGQLVRALLDGDRDRAQGICVAALADGRRRVDVFADLVQPALYDVGERWYRGDIGVAEEHQATAIVERIVADLGPTPTETPFSRTPTCVLAAVDSEQHTVGIRLFAMALEDDGWRTVMLGAVTPVPELVRVAREQRPQLVALTAGYVPRSKSLAAAVSELRELGVRVLAGGSAFNRSPALWQRIGADGHGADARIGLLLARRIAEGEA